MFLLIKKKKFFFLLTENVVLETLHEFIMRKVKAVFCPWNSPPKDHAHNTRNQNHSHCIQTKKNRGDGPKKNQLTHLTANVSKIV